MPQLGTATVLKVGGTTVAYGKSVSFDQSVDMVDITNKDSAGKRQFLPGDSSATLQFEGLFDNTASTTGGFELFNAAVQAGTGLTALFGGATGATYSYIAFVSSLNRSAPEGAEETFSCTLQCSGLQTKA